MIRDKETEEPNHKFNKFNKIQEFFEILQCNQKIFLGFHIYQNRNLCRISGRGGDPEVGGPIIEGWKKVLILVAEIGES